MAKENFSKFSSILSLLALSSFIYGFFAEQRAFAISGGVVLILLDVVAIWVGVLKPLFPLLFAIVLALLVKPWYYGVFWSCAVFQILNIPAYIAMLVKPTRQSRNGEQE